jgi:serine/threonine-protein kinase
MPGSGADEFEVLGTPAYLAPERLLYDAVEPASDVYALGVLLYRLLAGHSPWTIETTTQMLTAHIYLAPAPLLPMFQVPDSVTALCNRCLAKDPAQRPSAREAAALLANGAGLPVNADEPPSREQTAIDPEPSVPPEAVPTGTGGDATEPTAGKRSRAAYALAAVALLAAVAATLWLLHSPHRQSALSQAAPTAAASAGPPAAVGPLPGASTATATTAPARLGGGPPVVGGATVPGPVPAPAAPGKPTSAAPGTTAGPGPTVTTTAPAAEPPERTLSSSAGSVRAKCPAPRTAQILSWTATKPYKVTEGDKGAGPSPAVSFKHGNTHITMTVTCAGGVPSATTT